jgi:hypothetical protein
MRKVGELIALFGAHQSAPCGDDARHQAALGRKHAANRGNEILVEGGVRRDFAASDEDIYPVGRLPKVLKEA